MEINFKGSYISTSLIFHIIGPKTNQKVTSPFWSSYPFCFHLLSTFLLISLGDQKRETNQKVTSPILVIISLLLFPKKKKKKNPFCFHLLSLFLLISLGDQKREETNQKVSCSLCFSHLFLFLLHLCFTITYKSTRQEF